MKTARGVNIQSQSKISGREAENESKRERSGKETTLNRCRGKKTYKTEKFLPSWALIIQWEHPTGQNITFEFGI